MAAIGVIRSFGVDDIEWKASLGDVERFTAQGSDLNRT